jgi:hypothetical protein
VTLGAAIAALVAASIVAAYLAGAEVDGKRPELAQVLAPALLMGILAWGMWGARYWAVLGFQLILAFLIFSAVFGLAVQVSSVSSALAALGLLAVAGTLFYFMVKAMARIQMPRGPGRGSAPPRRAHPLLGTPVDPGKPASGTGRGGGSIGSCPWLIPTM